MQQANFDKLLKKLYVEGHHFYLPSGVGYTPRLPKQWRDYTFTVPRKCYFCKQTLWGKGRIGYVNWLMDAEVFRAHTTCQTMEVLSGDN